jgi:hypothetical protein
MMSQSGLFMFIFRAPFLCLGLKSVSRAIHNRSRLRRLKSRVAGLCNRSTGIYPRAGVLNASIRGYLTTVCFDSVSWLKRL